MKLLVYVKAWQWVPPTGYLFCVAALTAGYYYNLTFIQLGLVDLGTRLVGVRGSPARCGQCLFRTDAGGVSITRARVPIGAGPRLSR
jgi:hypothetical protein